MRPSRRQFLRSFGAGALSLTLRTGARGSFRLEKPVRLGLIADLHQDIMHDGKRRLDAFLKKMAGVKPDAILQLGDFAYPNEKNRPVIDAFNQAHKKSLHVIGNHDTDAGHTKQQCIDVWGMEGRYYAHDVSGLRLLVLDGNDKGSPTHKGGYVSYVGKEQIDWLEDQLARTELPVIVVSHQPLAGHAAVDNQKQVQQVLSAHTDKVVLAINGHTHIDQLHAVEKISYFHVNSASYKWVGGKYKHESYPKEIHQKYKWINHTCPYRDSLFTMLTVDPKIGVVRIEGATSEWVGKSPVELEIEAAPPLKHGEDIAPHIRQRNIPVNSE